MAKTEEDQEQRVKVGWKNREQAAMRSFERKPLHPAIHVSVHLLHSLALALPIALALMFIADAADHSLAQEVFDDRSISPLDIYILFYVISILAILLFKFIYFRWKRVPEREPLP